MREFIIQLEKMLAKGLTNYEGGPFMEPMLAECYAFRPTEGGLVAVDLISGIGITTVAPPTNIPAPTLDPVFFDPFGELGDPVTVSLSFYAFPAEGSTIDWTTLEIDPMSRVDEGFWTILIDGDILWTNDVVQGITNVPFAWRVANNFGTFSAWGTITATAI